MVRFTYSLEQSSWQRADRKDRPEAEANSSPSTEKGGERTDS